MSADNSEFFKGKRPWSNIKDRILRGYLSPYMAKVSKRGQQILYIDAFAGPGVFADGKPGSPMLACQAAEKYASGRYKAIFVNKEEEHHNELTNVISKEGWSNSVQTLLGDGIEVIKQVYNNLGNDSVFLYIDPFGLDCEFATLEPFLNRARNTSTEILINLNMAGVHRLAARKVYMSGDYDVSQINSYHDKLNRIFGGDYWRDPLLSIDPKRDTKAREQAVVNGYRELLASTSYLKFTGACPVLERRDSATKYYMIFASPHPDGMILMNNEMCKAFNEHVHEEETRDTLFAGQSWTEWHDTSELSHLITLYLTNGSPISRSDLWIKIVTDHFMKFTSSQYIKMIEQLVKSGKIACTTPVKSSTRPTNRLNDNCILTVIK